MIIPGHLENYQENINLSLLKINVFMTAANIRQKLHQYIDKGDEKLLKLMYAVVKEY